MGLVFVGQVRAAEGDLRARLDKRVYRDAKGEELPYRIFVPRNYDAKQSYPLIVFLHGAGERGNDNTSQLAHADVLRFVSDKVQAQHPCFLIAPQCPTNRKWVELPWGGKESQPMPKEPSRPMRLLLDLLDALEKQYHIDPQQRYVTGMSMGGFGTFDLLMRRPLYWAAAVPVCGGGDDSRAKDIASTPLWAFHGSDDNAVPVERSRSMIAALKAAGGTPKYTEYAGMGHGIWEKAYADPDLVQWLFSQRRPLKSK
jgi:predicted peptidase